MKKFLNNLFQLFLNKVVAIRLSYYKLKNQHKKKVFIFTDSRGFDVTKRTHKNNPFSLYTKYFIKNYNADVFVCPEETTSVYDFLAYYYDSKKNYDFVISHIGVVDFAPRSMRQTKKLVNQKKNKIIRFFGEKKFNDLKNFEGYDTHWNDDKTSSIAPDFMIELFANEFNKIPNLIWISCNDIDLNWWGNYFRARPLNSAMINLKSKKIIAQLKSDSIVNLSNLTNEEIKKYTCDNVHLTQEGSQYILNNLIKIINHTY